LEDLLVNTVVLKNFKTHLIILILLGLSLTLPQNIFVFGGVCIFLIFFTINEPIKVLYVSIGIISFRYLFVDLGTMLMTDFTIFAPYRFRDQDSLFIKNYHNFIFIYLFIALFIQNFRFRKFHVDNSVSNKIFFLISVFTFWTLVSSLFNSISLEVTLLFYQLFLRPVLLLLLIMKINWEEEEIRKFVIFLFIIIFPLQIIPSFIENIPNMTRGYVFFVDQFTGTFAYNFNYLTVMFLSFGVSFLFVEYLRTKKKKVLIFLLVCVFSIISAQSGFQSFVLFISCIPAYFYVVANSNSFNIGVIKGNITLIYFTVVLSLLFLIIIINPDLGGSDYVVSYSEDSAQKVFLEGFAETPKVRTYEILFENIFNGRINPLFGLGPGQYLSGAAGKYGNQYLKFIEGNPMLFKSGLFSNMLTFPHNNFVGLVGETGLIGYIIVLSMFLIPFLYVSKNIKYYRRSAFWSTISGGFIFIFFMTMGWSLFWNVFEDSAMCGFYYTFAGILIMVHKLDLLKEDACAE